MNEVLVAGLALALFAGGCVFLSPTVGLGMAIGILVCGAVLIDRLERD